MPTLHYWSRFEVVVSGDRHVGGSLTEPHKLTVDGPLADLRKSLAPETTWTAWEAGAHDPLADFDYLRIESDLAGVLVELTTDVNGLNGKEVYTVALAAGRPLELLNDGSLADYTENFAGGVLDTITRIRVRNPDDETSANVRVVLVT